jgi:hypothetical protein
MERIALLFTADKAKWQWFFLEKGPIEKIKLRKAFSRYRIIRAGPLAQLVEQLTLNQRVAGSSPSGITILKTSHVAKNVAFFVVWVYK